MNSAYKKVRSLIRKKKCANCGKEVEVEEIPGVFTINIAFCSEKCSRKFWIKDAIKRKQIGFPPLRNGNGNVAFPV